MPSIFDNIQTSQNIANLFGQLPMMNHGPTADLLNQGVGQIQTQMFGAPLQGQLENSLFLGEDFRQGATDQMLRSIGSLQAQTRNRAADNAAFRNLPEATRLAQERGIALQGAKAAQEGAFAIDQAVASGNINSAKFLLNQMMQRELNAQALEQQNEGDFLSILGGLGAGVGSLLGLPAESLGGSLLGPLFGGGGSSG